MQSIGIIASNSSETEARVILFDQKEKIVQTESLVEVNNLNEGKIMAVLRKGTGNNETLNPGFYNPGVAYARIGGQPSNAKEIYDFSLSVIGVIDESVEQNKKIIAPGSPVQLYEDIDNPMAKLAGPNYPHSIGYYVGHPTWSVTVDHTFISYHIGIFASTGGGKSYLARHEVIPFLTKTGYSILILDWKGRDYAPYFPKDQVLSISDIALDIDTIVSYLSEKMGNFGYVNFEKRGTVTQALEDFIYQQKWRNLSIDKFRLLMENTIISSLNKNNAVSGKPYEEEQRFRRGLSKLHIDHIANILGTKTPNDLLEITRKKKILVLDMKKTGKNEKLSAFLTLAHYFMEIMQQNEDLDVALVLDEAPQYCPYKPSGIQSKTTDIIIDICALGRTHKLCMCLLSQGIAGEIGINAAVRRNLNTQFIGKIHPLDMMEASNWLSPFNIDPKFLLSLTPGNFYFMGNMNPSPIPLLLTFELSEKNEM